MKKLLAGLWTISILVIAACNNNKQNNTHEQNMNHDSMTHDTMQMDTMKDMKHDTMSSMNHDNPDHSMAGMSAEATATKVNLGDTDPAVKKLVNTITSQYLIIKNGLAGDNNTEAKKGAVQLNSAIKKFDKSFFTASQKKEFDKYADNMNDQLQGITAAKQIEEQRALFGVLSQQVYDLVKLFGANQILYYDHCPMAFNNKGAMWLSETKEITNPYLGSSMLTCGTVQEIVQ